MGHLHFVDNFNEGIIIFPEHSNKIQLINKAARSMLNLPNTTAESMEARMKDDNYDMSLCSKVKLTQIKLLETE